MDWQGNMRNITPAPISTPIVAPNPLPLPWSLWFRDISDYFRDSLQLTRGDGNIEYCVSGIAVHLHVEGTISTSEMKLPFTVLKSKYINYYLDGEAVKYKLTKGDTTIKLPTTGEVLLDDYYLAEIK